MLESLLNKIAGLKVCNFIKKETPPQLFFCEYCEIFKNSFFHGTPWLLLKMVEEFLRNSEFTLEELRGICT